MIRVLQREICTTEEATNLHDNKKSMWRQESSSVKTRSMWRQEATSEDTEYVEAS